MSAPPPTTRRRSQVPPNTRYMDGFSSSSSLSSPPWMTNDDMGEELKEEKKTDASSVQPPNAFQGMMNDDDEEEPALVREDIPVGFREIFKKQIESMTGESKEQKETEERKKQVKTYLESSCALHGRTGIVTTSFISILGLLVDNTIFPGITLPVAGRAVRLVSHLESTTRSFNPYFTSLVFFSTLVVFFAISQLSIGLQIFLASTITIGLIILFSTLCCLPKTPPLLFRSYTKLFFTTSLFLPRWVLTNNECEEPEDGETEEEAKLKVYFLEKQRLKIVSGFVKIMYSPLATVSLFLVLLLHKHFAPNTISQQWNETDKYIGLSFLTIVGFAYDWIKPRHCLFVVASGLAYWTWIKDDLSYFGNLESWNSIFGLYLMSDFTWSCIQRQLMKRHDKYTDELSKSVFCSVRKRQFEEKYQHALEIASNRVLLKESRQLDEKEIQAVYHETEREHNSGAFGDAQILQEMSTDFEAHLKKGEKWRDHWIFTPHLWLNITTMATALALLSMSELNSSSLVTMTQQPLSLWIGVQSKIFSFVFAKIPWMNFFARKGGIAENVQAPGTTSWDVSGIMDLCWLSIVWIFWNGMTRFHGNHRLFQSRGERRLQRWVMMQPATFLYCLPQVAVTIPALRFFLITCALIEYISFTITVFGTMIWAQFQKINLEKSKDCMMQILFSVQNQENNGLLDNFVKYLMPPQQSPQQETITATE